MRRHAILVLSLFLVSLVSSPPASRASNLGLAADPGQRLDSDVIDDLAASTLAEDWGLSLSEAKRRILVQPHFEPLALQAQEALGDSFAGMWVDHANGGQVVINSTRPAAALLKLKTPDDLRLTTQIVPHGLDELRSIARALSPPLAIANKHARVPITLGIVIPANQVVVQVPNDSVRTAGQAQFLLAAKRTFGHAVGVTEDAAPITALSHDGTTRDCDRYTWDRDACDNPLRGGIRISANVNCTSGFNAISQVDGLPYLITAGHCLDADPATELFDDPQHHAQMWQQRMHLDWSWHNIGRNHSYRFGLNGDMAILHVDNPSGWGGSDGDPDPWVIVLPSTGPDDTRADDDTTEDFEYYIDGIGGWANVGINGGYICSTGDGSGTRCGQITAIDMTVTYVGTGRTVADLAQVSYSSCLGDSGGPVYKMRLAFGIQVAHSGEERCGTPSYYQGASNIQNQLNVWILTRDRD